MFVVCYTHFKDLINLHDITSYHNFILLAINYAKKCIFFAQFGLLKKENTSIFPVKINVLCIKYDTQQKHIQAFFKTFCYFICHAVWS